jgi:hypothetical protein
MADDTFSGIWRCSYWYPSNNHDGEDVSEYYVNVRKKGDNKLVLESLPNETEAYMLVKLTVDGDLAAGSWEEHTAPKGEFQGMIYSGVLQLVVSPDKEHMEGMWVGVGRDHESNTARIYTGRWELARSAHPDVQ